MYDAATMDAWSASFEEPESGRQATDSVNPRESIDPSRSTNLIQAAFRDIGNEEINRRVADHLQDLI